MKQGCTGKRSHDTYASARIAQLQMQDKARTNQILGIYLCTYCGKYHLGTKNGKRLRLIEAFDQIAKEREGNPWTKF